MPRRPPPRLLLPLLCGALALAWPSLATAEPPAAEPAPPSATTPEPSAPEAPTTASPETRPTVPVPAARPETRPTIPAPPRPPPAEPVHHLEPPGTVAQYDEAIERLEHEVRTTTGRRQATALADLAQVQRWYDEDVHRNGGTLAVGIVLLVAHPALIAGGVTAAIGDSLFSFGGGRGTSEAQIVSIPLVIGSLIALGAGIALTASGAARRIRTPSEREDWRARHAAAPSSPVKLSFGLGSLSGAF